MEEICQIQDSLLEIKQIISTERIKKLGSLSQAVWQQELKLAEITHQVGSHWSKVGQRINKKLYAYPEEALYLLESGCLEITYNDVPISIQRAYFVLLGSNTGVSVEKYRVYSFLSGLGYKVVRHSPQNQVKSFTEKVKVQDEALTSMSLRRSNSEPDIEVSKPSKKLKVKDLRSLVECNESYNIRETLRKLEFIHSHFNVKDSKLNIDFDIYTPAKKECSNKSSKKGPDCRIVIYRGCDPMPKLDNLARQFQDNVPVISAIVFPDHIAFYEINFGLIPNAFDC
ncbi:hypothetical protein RUM44_011211 [Polyplax serrata]|uniref:tRNA-splicing endonuclease subunit Sen54 N-terminal domain-containing protein n=1 Tax=Polyplax serrata TaxID=468196 RepID=A0ABR1APD8_POLSC